MGMGATWSSSARCSGPKECAWWGRLSATFPSAGGQKQRGDPMAPSKVTVHPSALPPPAGRAGDLALVERCRQGDLGAFEEIYRAHSAKLYSLALRMLGNPADAEDLLQEIFLSAHRKLEGFRGDAALGTWLYRLATNQCLDYLRSRAAKTSQITGYHRRRARVIGCEQPGSRRADGGEDGSRTRARAVARRGARGVRAPRRAGPRTPRGGRSARRRRRDLEVTGPQGALEVESVAE